MRRREHELGRLLDDLEVASGFDGVEKHSEGRLLESAQHVVDARSALDHPVLEPLGHATRDDERERASGA